MPARGVTGIRFQFGLAGGGVSTAFSLNSSGVPTPAVSPTWLQNLQYFFSDVHISGIQNITPTPALDGWTATPSTGLPAVKSVTEWLSCPPPGNVCPHYAHDRYFFPWLPYAVVYEQTGTNPVTCGFQPDGGGINSCYAFSPGNPTFWGWQPLFTLFGDIFTGAYNAGLTIEEFDLSNEVDLWDFPVQARLIYDNTTSTPVFSQIASLLNANFPSAVVTTSVSASSPNPGDPNGPGLYDCESVYGDSGMHQNLSELLAAVTGYDFGKTSGSLAEADGAGGMWCYNASAPNGLENICGPPQNTQAWAQCATYGMISTPVPQAAPGLLDVHTTPSCVLSSSGVCEESNSAVATAQAKTSFSDFWVLMLNHGLTGATAMFGELPNNQPGRNGVYCDSQTPFDALNSVAGYLASSLYAAAGSHTVLRPWENSVSSCYVIPANIGETSEPYQE